MMKDNDEQDCETCGRIDLLTPTPSVLDGRIYHQCGRCFDRRCQDHGAVLHYLSNASWWDLPTEIRGSITVWIDGAYVPGLDPTVPARVEAGPADQQEADDCEQILAMMRGAAKAISPSAGETTSFDGLLKSRIKAHLHRFLEAAKLAVALVRLPA